METKVLDASTKEAMKKRCEDFFSIICENPEREISDIQWVVDSLIETGKKHGQDVGAALHTIRHYEHLLLDLIKIKYDIE